MTGRPEEPEKKLEDTLLRTHCNARLTAPLLVTTAFRESGTGHAAPPVETTSSAIVPVLDAASAARRVEAVGGIVTRERGIIRVVGARPPAAQRDRPAGLRGVLHLHDGGQLLGGSRRAAEEVDDASS